jgi:plasmid stability protein
MTSLNINLPDHLTNRLRARAIENGYETIEQYAQALLEADASDDEVVDEDIEQLLLERLDDPRPDIEFTPQFKEQFRKQVNERRQSRGS